MTSLLADLSAPIASLPLAQDHDRRIQKDAKAALLASGYRTVAELDCKVTAGEIMLSGVVSSYYLKQIAQEVVLRLKVVRSVQNAVQVQPW